MSKLIEMIWMAVRSETKTKGAGTAKPVKFITQIWQPDNIQSDFFASSSCLWHIYQTMRPTARAKVPMCQVTFSAAQSESQIKRKQKTWATPAGQGRSTCDDPKRFG